MIEIKDLNKTYHLKTGDVQAVRDVNLSIRDGEIYGIIGYSGAGKSSLVRCLNLLEMPDSGVLRINDFPEIVIENGKTRLSEKDLGRMRRGMGMIFQHFNLLDRGTVFDNIAYPLKYSGMSRRQIADRVMELLNLVDLTDKRDVYPSQLSGGQKQRVAIARALANNPGVLLSDEATSALDPEATESILNLLRTLNQTLGLTIVLITHEMAVIKSICQRVAVMENGYVVEEGNVYDIFANPKEEITRRFVNSASPLSRVHKMIAEDNPLVRIQPGEVLVRLTFDRDCVGESVISEVSRSCSVNMNIVLANVDIIDGAPLGGMVTILSGSPENLERAFAFFEKAQIHVRRLK